MRGCLITATGWVISVIDEMPFRDALDLFKYWSKYPPVHILVRGFVGYEAPDSDDDSPTRTPTQVPTDSDVRGLSGLPGYDIKGLPDWHREALERALKQDKEPANLHGG